MDPFIQISQLCFAVYIIITTYMADATIEVYDPYNKKVDTIPDKEYYSFEDDIDILGFIVLADPPDGCGPIAEPPFLTNFTVNKFVLINGTDMCKYITKIRNAEKAGYDLAVIFDPTPNEVEFARTTHFPEYEFHLPVVLVSFEDGLKIKNYYLYNSSYLYNYKLKIMLNLPDMSYYMWLFGAVIGVCFFVMVLFMMCLLIKCIQEKRKSRRNRLSSRQIKQIPTAKFTKGDQYDVCAICLEDYNEGDKLRILPCSHAYHAKCIDPWLMNNRRTCPLCKRKITFGDSADESDSEDSELTSPAENTPLLTSPSHQGQSWGTFVNPIRTLNDIDIDGPSSLPDTFQYTENTLLPHNVSAAYENPNISDDEADNLLPPPHHSVNGQSNLSDSDDHGQTVVQVNFVSENRDTAASNLQHGLIV